MIDIHQIENALNAKLTVKELHNIHGNVTSLAVQNNGSFTVVADIGDDMDELISHINCLVEIEQGWEKFKVVEATNKVFNQIEGVSGEFQRVEFGVYRMSLKIDDCLEYFMRGYNPTLTIELEHDLVDAYTIKIEGIDKNHEYYDKFINALYTLNKKHIIKSL